MSNFTNKILGNRYTLLEKVGDGGMALVYKARCELLNRYVAVKILRPEFSSDENFTKKFKSESQAVASLSHPNIVNVYDVGNEDGLSYIVMEFVEGINLKDYVREHGKLEHMEALKIVKQIAKALEHAHKNGVIHRDIKPHNILITKDKVVKVADFGIAKATTGSTMINTKTVMGSVHYLSPEQARGSLVDNKTDIYSLGIVMYELLTGEVPFDGDSPVSIAIKHIQEELKDPLELRKIPEGIASIVIKATQKDPLKRYQNLTEMIEDINIVEKNPNAKLGLIESTDSSTRVIPVEQIESAMKDMTQKMNLEGSKGEEEENFDTTLDNAFDNDEIDEEIDRYNSEKANERAYVKTREPEVKKKKRKVLPVILAIIVFAVFAGTVYGIVSNNKAEVKLMDVVGMQEEIARKNLEGQNLKVESTVVESEKPKGEVVEMAPSAGNMVKEGSTIELKVSQGNETVEVPDLTGKTLDEAKEILANLGLGLEKIGEEYSSDIASGKIIKQDVSEGTSAEKRTSIGVIVSKGENESKVIVPDVTNRSLEDAKSLLEAIGLKYSVVYTSDNNLGNDVVKSQSVSSGSTVNKNSTIKLTVNKITNSTPNKENESKPSESRPSGNSDGKDKPSASGGKDSDKNGGSSQGGSTDGKKPTEDKNDGNDKEDNNNNGKDETTLQTEEQKVQNNLGGLREDKKDI